MLIELQAKNLATIDDVRLQFGKGFTVLSGDEGAGKSLLVDALCLLAGGRASANLIRNGTSGAFVEGVFNLDGDDSGLKTVLDEAGIEIDPDGTLILTREVQEQGRGIARVNGRAVPVTLLRQLGHFLIDIHSQMEHMSLLNPQSQLELLDSFAGLDDRRTEVGRKIAQLRQAIEEMKAGYGQQSQQQRELMEFQVAEIDSAGIEVGEGESLQKEWQILQRVQELKEAGYVVGNTLYADDPSATALIHQAIKTLRGASSINPTLNGHIEALESAAAQIEETARSISQYVESVEDNPERIREVEKRLDLLHRLKQKYGPTLEKVIEFAETTRKELLSIQSQGERRRQLQAQCQKLREEAGYLAAELSRAREKAARKLTEQVNEELADLAMKGAKFDIKIVREEAQDGLPFGPPAIVTEGRRAGQSACAFTQSGIDRVQFLASTNPGEPPKPLVFIASGGETCRFMLALKSALRQADLVPTLIFDEIDAGIGGRNAQTVGRKLAALAHKRQVICITHLPQVACFGTKQYRIAKHISGGRAVTSALLLNEKARVRELAVMLGSGGEPMLMGAEALLKCARDEVEKEPVKV